jgi:hypothetical protein
MPRKRKLLIVLLERGFGQLRRSISRVRAGTKAPRRSSPFPAIRATRLSAAVAAMTIAALLAPAPARAQSSAPATSCDPGTALTADRIVGPWTDAANGRQVEIKAKSPGDTSHFTLKGTHDDWDGTLDGSKLTFKRKPSVAEMQSDAPAWARQAVLGQIEWSLELEAREKCGVPDLSGKWYPGLIKVDEEKDSGGKILSQKASVAGKGTPLDMHYTRQPPAIYGVVVLEDQTRIGPSGLPDHGYPFPVAPAVQSKNGALDPIPVEYPVPRLPPKNGLGTAGDRRTIFVYGQGLPRDYSSKITIAGTIGGDNLEYTVQALDTDKTLSPEDKKKLDAGRKEAMKDINDADTRALAQKAQAMLVRVDIRKGALPGLKEFTVNGVGGKSSWHLQFGDDRAIVSFARDTAYGEHELTTSLFTPERAFIEVHTEVAYPIDHLDLRVELNDRPVIWTGAKTIVARLDPYDKTKTTYRTARIDLYDRIEPPATPNVARLQVKPGDELRVRLDDEALLHARFHATTVHRTPGDLGMLWKEALSRAAEVKGVTVTDWSQLSGQKADEISNIIIMDFSRATVPVTVGDLAALLMFRDEFVVEMEAAQKELPTLSDDAAYRGLRTSLKASVWDPDSAWKYIRIACPGGGECPFTYALSDTYLDSTFKDNPKGADQWSLQAVKEGLAKYQQAAKDAIAKAKAVKDDDVEGLLGLLAQDCTSEALDLPCGYKALRPNILPRLMRLTDVPGNPPRQVWVPDLNARYVLRNLYTLVSAEKSQRDYSKLDTQMAMLMLSGYAAPLMLEGGITAEAASWVVDTTYFGVTLANEIPDAIASRQEIQFALGASLVMGPERLSKTAYDKSAWFQWMQTGTSVVAAMVPSVLSTYRVVGEINSAIVAARVKAGGAQAYDLLNDVQKNALARMATEAELAKEAGDVKALTSLDKDADEAFRKAMTEKGASPPAEPPAKPSASASGGPTPKFDELEQPPDEKADLQAEQAEPEPPPEPRRETPVANVTAAERFDIMLQPPPVAGGKWKNVLNGQVVEFELGNRIGKDSVYAKVFEIKGPRIAGCEEGCVIKIYEKPWQQEAVPDIVHGSKLLGDEVLQPKLHFPDSTAAAPVPYVIAEKLQFNETDLVIFDYSLPDIEKFEADPALGDALRELAGKLSDMDINFADMNLPNVYFKKTGGKWQAGILDTDFVIKHGQPPSPRMARLYRDFEYRCAIGDFDKNGRWYAGNNSLWWTRETTEANLMDDWNRWRGDNRPSFATLSEQEKMTQRHQFKNGIDVNGKFNKWDYFDSHPESGWPSAKYTMEKTLESKGYIHSGWKENPQTGQWELKWEGDLIGGHGRPLDEATWKKSFPKLFERERPVPIQIKDPTFKTGMADPPANVVPFVPKPRFAQIKPDALEFELKVAA